MKKLSVIMPFLNESKEPYETVKSMCETADPNRFEIIAIDDFSDNTIDLSDFKNVNLIRNDKRIGVDECRHKGVKLASNNYILIIDAHMRFKKDNWLNKMIDCIDREPSSFWCCVCGGLGYGNLDMNRSMGKYYGANMLFFDPNADPKRPSRECLEPKWAFPKDEDEYKIQCVLGANYFFRKEQFLHIRGLSGLKSWGSSEVFLSLKNYLAGADCRITKNIEIGHVFRDNAPYTTFISDLYYNKIYISKLLFPEGFADRVIECLPNNVNCKKALDQVIANEKEIADEKAYYDGIFTKNIYDYCDEFSIKIT